MHIPEIDEPTKLSGPFWITLCLVEAAFCWLFTPWVWDYPVWYRIIGAVLIPFLAAMTIYCTTMFVVSLIHNFRSQRQTFALFSLAIVVGGLVVAFAWVMSGFRTVPESAVFTAGFLANGLFIFLNRRRHLSSESSKTSESEFRP